MPLKGKTVFITGGTGGIGRPLVDMLKRAGASVEIYDRSKDGDLFENLDRTCERLKQNSPDILINMAGFNDFNYCEDHDYKALINVNMLTPMRLTQAVLPEMRRRNSGQIVNIGSMTALIPLPHVSGYVAAKAGLKGFNDALRRELSRTGISVTHVIPRAVQTGMNSGARAEINKRTNVHHDDPEKVAAIIMRAILSKKAERRIGWPERFFAFLNANFPFIIDQGLQKNCKIGEQILAEYSTQKQHHEEMNNENIVSIKTTA
jgi:short-subunit dehydrogenase